MALLFGSLLAGCAQPGWRQQLQSEDPLRRIDGVIAAGRAKDPAAAPLLVDRLQDDDEAVRMYAIMALRRIEGTDLGYKYWADNADRTHMAQRWRTYLKNRQSPQSQPAVARHESGSGPADSHPDGPGTAPSSQPQSTGGQG
jgi:hypothetical protein